MRIALLSDIHSNYLALKGVLEDTMSRNINSYWFLGDLVGYGPNPVEVLRWIKGDLDGFPGPEHWVMGNHDTMFAALVLQGKTGATPELLNDKINYPMDPEIKLPNDLNSNNNGYKIYEFKISENNTNQHKVQYRGKSRDKLMEEEHWKELSNAVPLIAIELNRLSLMRMGITNAYWEDLFIPEKANSIPITIGGVDFLLSHWDRYVYPWYKEVILPSVFNKLEEKSHGKRPCIQLMGHTHVPMLAKNNVAEKPAMNNRVESIQIEPGVAYPIFSEPESSSMAIINPGSVGQPRDKDPRAAFAIIDTDEKNVTFHRVPYDFRKTALQLSKDDYPRFLRERLLRATPTNSTPQDWLNHFDKIRG